MFWNYKKRIEALEAEIQIMKVQNNEPIFINVGDLVMHFNREVKVLSKYVKRDSSVWIKDSFYTRWVCVVIGEEDTYPYIVDLINLKPLISNK